MLGHCRLTPAGDIIVPAPCAITLRNCTIPTAVPNCVNIFEKVLLELSTVAIEYLHTVNHR